MAKGFEETNPIGLRFSERMSGYLAEGVGDFAEGERVGKKQNNFLIFDATIQIEEVNDFYKLAGRKARLAGTISYKPLGQNLLIRNGEFNLFRPDRETGKRHMTYSFGFTGGDGNEYFLYGYKVIYDDPHEFDLGKDLTSLFTRIHRGFSPEGPLLGSGIMHFRLKSLPSMLVSFTVTKTWSPFSKLKALYQFGRFCYGEIRDTYLSKVSPIYHTEYENLVLHGKLTSKEGETKIFFFFSGIHDKDFPWGDDGIFWDVALVIQRADGTWARYALTDRVIDGLELDVEKGSYRYEGPLYQLLEGYEVSQSEIQKSALPKHPIPIRNWWNT